MVSNRLLFLLVLLFMPGMVFGASGCLDRDGTSLSSKSQNDLGISAFMSCGRGSALCQLFVRFPGTYHEATLSYDTSKRGIDDDLSVDLPVVDWDEGSIQELYRPSGTRTFLLPTFHGVRFSTTKRMSKDLSLLLDNGNCGFIEINDLSGWMKSDSAQ